MNYQISEDEYNSLESLNNQLGLIAGLLSFSDSDLRVITSNELFAFLAARSKDLANVLNAASEHKAAAQGPQKLATGRKRLSTRLSTRRAHRLMARAPFVFAALNHTDWFFLNSSSHGGMPCILSNGGDHGHSCSR